VTKFPILLSGSTAFTILLNSVAWSSQEIYRIDDPHEMQRNEQGIREEQLNRDWLGYQLWKNHTTSQNYRNWITQEHLQLPPKIINLLKEQQAFWKRQHLSPTELRQAQVKTVNDWVNGNIKYSEFPHGLRTPKQIFTETMKDPDIPTDKKQYWYGDCKDFLIAKASMLHYLGVDPQDIVTVLGVMNNKNDPTSPRFIGHAMLGVRSAPEKGDWVFLDISAPSLKSENLLKGSPTGDGSFAPFVLINSSGTFNLISFTTGDRALGGPIEQQKNLEKLQKTHQNLIEQREHIKHNLEEVEKDKNLESSSPRLMRGLLEQEREFMEQLKKVEFELKSMPPMLHTSRRWSRHPFEMKTDPATKQQEALDRALKEQSKPSLRQRQEQWRRNKWDSQHPNYWEAQKQYEEEMERYRTPEQKRMGEKLRDKKTSDFDPFTNTVRPNPVNPNPANKASPKSQQTEQQRDQQEFRDLDQMLKDAVKKVEHPRDYQEQMEQNRRDIDRMRNDTLRLEKEEQQKQNTPILNPQYKGIGQRREEQNRRDM
jgi:predicted transglutaminase-like cysteine proteinase